MRNRMKKLSALILSSQDPLDGPSTPSSLPVGILGSALKSNTMLRCLNLNGNPLDLDQLVSLMRGVKHSSIKSLALSCCKVCDRGLEVVLTNLPTTVKFLALTRNLFTSDESNNLLVATAKRHDSLEEVYVDTDLACWNQLCYFTRLNRGGRRLLTAGGALQAEGESRRLVRGGDVPAGLWPVVFERVNRIDWTIYQEDAEAQGFKEDVIYALFQGPAFLRTILGR